MKSFSEWRINMLEKLELEQKQGQNQITMLPVSIHQEYIKAFLTSLDVSDFSKQLYKRNLRHFFDFIKQEQISTLKREDIIRYKETLLKEKKPSTVNAYLVPVRLFYQFMSDVGAYPNIATGVKKVKEQVGNKKSALSKMQVKRLFSYLEKQEGAKAERDYTIINLMLRTGLRDIEVIRANIGDIGTEAGQAVLYVWGKGRTGKDSFVVLTETMYNILMDYLMTRGEINEEEPLFVSMSRKNYGKRLTTRSISRIVKNAFCACGLNSSKLTAHSLRHTAVTAALLAGASVQDAKEMARHSNIATTMIYAHNIERIGESAAERKVDSWLE